MIGVLLGFAWTIGLTVAVLTNPHPHLDLRHCGYDPIAFVQSCFPKHGCYMSDPSRAMCWDRATFTKK